MTFKDHGYYGYAYLGARVGQGLALLPIMGLVGNLLSLIARSKHSAPTELVATIVFVSSISSPLCLSVAITLSAPYSTSLFLSSTSFTPFLVTLYIGRVLTE